VRHSQSHLSSLATLLQNAEARHSAVPPALAADAGKEDDSGLIDILAMQRQAREERVSAAAATKTPIPVVTAVRGGTTDPDFVASLTRSRRRTKRAVLGVVTASVLMLAVAIGLGVRTSHRNAAAAAARAALAASAAAAAAAPPPPAVVVPSAAPPATQPPLPVLAPEPVAASGPASGKAKKGRKAHPSKPKGPKLMKVTSSGT
jgi:hypothetical protein